ncbi:unnamed protein product [Adineta steineri]|uniref:Uncharacterized protein n=1 Tax=Adineta steineri TaxID=433720 RepID=A0A814KQ79_9BILA|nr:unnamed protein product [Adineta steineri]CAF1344434.1 unnamed protein product [Adineta steineri]
MNAKNEERLLNQDELQDRTYFLNIIKSKISEVKLEIQRLQHEIESLSENKRQYIVLNKTAEDLSEKVKNLQNDLEDYNMARMNSFCDVTKVKKEIQDLNAHNQQVESSIEQMYLEKQRKEEQIQRLEYELTNDKQKLDTCRTNLDYNQIKTTSDQLQYERNCMENEISILDNRMNKMREQMLITVTQQEALSLIEQISELEIKHYQLINDNQNLSTTEEAYEKLTNQMNEDNEELIFLEQQISELCKHNENLKQLVDNNIPEHEIDDELFLLYERISNDIKTIQKTNLDLIVLIQDNCTQLNIKFNQYKNENEKSHNTIIILIEQHRKLKQDYMNLEVLDKKLLDELQELKIKYSKMQEDLHRFNDLESLKHKAEKRKQQLIADKINMIRQKQITNMEIQTLQTQFESIQKQLQDNEIHQQIVNLEKKLQTASETLFTLDELQASQNFQNQYEQVKHQALQLVENYNRWLIEQYKKSSI